MSETDHYYPDTVWSRYREDWLPHLFVVAALLLAAGALLGIPWTEAIGTAVAAFALASLVIALVFEYRAAMRYDLEHPDEYRLVLTEDGYTTADGPMPKGEALAEFDRLASGASPHSGSRLRVMTEVEYERVRRAAIDTDPDAYTHRPNQAGGRR